MYVVYVWYVLAWMSVCVVCNVVCVWFCVYGVYGMYVYGVCGIYVVYVWCLCSMCLWYVCSVSGIYVCVVCVCTVVCVCACMQKQIHSQMLRPRSMPGVLLTLHFSLPLKLDGAHWSRYTSWLWAPRMLGLRPPSIEILDVCLQAQHVHQPQVRMLVHQAP